MTRLIESARTFWLHVTGRAWRDRAKPLPDVIVHDPDASRPRDLDDSFHDPEIQSRVAKVIARSAGKPE